LDEDDFGVPVRGRTKSAETTRDHDADSLLDLDLRVRIFAFGPILRLMSCQLSVALWDLEAIRGLGNDPTAEIILLCIWTISEHVRFIRIVHIIIKESHLCMIFKFLPW